MSLVNSPEEFFITGALGATICGIYSIFIFYSHGANFFSMNWRQNWIHTFDHRNFIRFLLFIFASSQMVFYIGLAISKQEYPPDVYYSCHLFATWSLYVAFVMLCTLWVNEVNVSGKVKICSRRLRNLWIFGYTSLKLVILIQIAIKGRNHTMWRLLYRIFFTTSFICFVIMSVVFLSIGGHARMRIPRISASLVSTKLNSIFIIITFSFLLHISAMTVKWVCFLSLKHCVSISPIMWFIFSNILPNSGFVVVTYYLIRDQSKRQKNNGIDSYRRLTGTETTQHSITREIVAGNAMYGQSSPSGFTRRTSDSFGAV